MVAFFSCYRVVEQSVTETHTPGLQFMCRIESVCCSVVKLLNSDLLKSIHLTYYSCTEKKLFALLLSNTIIEQKIPQAFPFDM
jgi:hypothetical protein